MDDLYRDHILDHYERPRHKGKLAMPDVSAAVSNPLCGDTISVEAHLSDGKATITEIAFQGKGCIISQAAASMLMESVAGRPVSEVKALEVRDVLDLLGVQLSPGRIKCAALGLTALKRSLEHLTES